MNSLFALAQFQQSTMYSGMMPLTSPISSVTLPTTVRSFSLQIFSTCTEFIRTIPTLPYSLTKVEDIDSDAEDHIYDEARYFLMDSPMPVRATPKYEPAGYDPFREN